VESVEILPLTVVHYVKTSGIVDDRVKLKLGQRISRFASFSENKQAQTYVVHRSFIRIALIRSTSRLEARWEPVAQSGVVRRNQMSVASGATITCLLHQFVLPAGNRQPGRLSECSARIAHAFVVGWLACD
jgi:hypothetical protein